MISMSANESNPRSAPISAELRSSLDRGLPLLRSVIADNDDDKILVLIDDAHSRLRMPCEDPVFTARLETVLQCLLETAADRGLSTPPLN